MPNRPSVAKLSFQVTPGHCRLIFSDTVLAMSLESFGSSNAPGEMRLRITNVAIWHLHATCVYIARDETSLLSTLSSRSSRYNLSLTRCPDKEQNSRHHSFWLRSEEFLLCLRSSS